MINSSTISASSALNIASGTGILLYPYVKSALHLADSSGNIIGYGGSTNPCSANAAPTTISAVGALGGCTSAFLTANQTITLSQDVSGSGTTAITATVKGIQTVAVTSTAPADHQILTYVKANTDWEPATITASAPLSIATSTTSSTSFTVACSTCGTGNGTVTTSSAGTTNTLPIWTSASALGNSHESESGTSTFINNSSTYFGTNTSTATSSLVWVSNYAGGGYWDATGTIPTLTSCGTSPTSTGNQWRSRIVVGSTATACTETFPVSFVKTPSCIVTNESMSITSAMSYSETTTTLIISQAVGLGGDILDTDCVGQSE